MDRESACLPKSSSQQYYQRKDLGASPFNLRAGSAMSSSKTTPRLRSLRKLWTAVAARSTSQPHRTALTRVARAAMSRLSALCGWTWIAGKVNRTPPRKKGPKHLTPSSQHPNYLSPWSLAPAVDSMSTGRSPWTLVLTSGDLSQPGCEQQRASSGSTLTQHAPQTSPASCAPSEHTTESAGKFPWRYY